MSQDEVVRHLPGDYVDDIVSFSDIVKKIERMEEKEQQIAFFGKDVMDFADEWNVDPKKVRRCWISGKLTANPIRLPYPECPHIVCSHSCLIKATSEWLGI